MNVKNIVEIVQGDITKFDVDAIVNAANNQLLPGGGVCGAIHRAAGPELFQACKEVGECPTGDARMTKGYCLPARHVIHTVGPVWQGGNQYEADMLAYCYITSLAIAWENELKTIAFPAISTGIYGYPLEPATRIAIMATLLFLDRHPGLEKVIFVCFDDATQQMYEDVWESLKDQDVMTVIFPLLKKEVFG